MESAWVMLEGMITELSLEEWDLTSRGMCKALLEAEGTASAQTCEGRLKSQVSHGFLFSNPECNHSRGRSWNSCHILSLFSFWILPAICKRGLLLTLSEVSLLAPHCSLLIILCFESSALLFLRIGRGKIWRGYPLLPMGKENVIFPTQKQIPGGW